MVTQITKQNENCTLDVVKFAASVLVTASHMPGLFSSVLVEDYYSGWFFRFCVPLFFASTGYFFQKSTRKKQTLLRMAWLFTLSYVLYLPQILDGAGNIAEVLSRLRWNLVIGYEHLWYLSAAFAGLLVWYFLDHVPVLSGLMRHLAIPVSIALLLSGALLDEHYRWLGIDFLEKVGLALSNFGGPRNVVFMGLPLMLLGGGIARYETQIRRIPTVVLLVLWVLLRGLAFWEYGWLVAKLGPGLSTDMSLFGMWPGVILLVLSFRFHLPIPEKTAKLMRKLSEYIYVLHPLVMVQICRCIQISPRLLLPMTIGMCALVYILLEKQFAAK
jgi:fucose 4-O-acetylase-like acetyltransferase